MDDAASSMARRRSGSSGRRSSGPSRWPDARRGDRRCQRCAGALPARDPSVALALLAARPARRAISSRGRAPLRPRVARALRAAPRRARREASGTSSPPTSSSPRRSSPMRARGAPGPTAPWTSKSTPGVEEEIEAAADWVARQVLRRHPAGGHRRARAGARPARAVSWPSAWSGCRGPAAPLPVHVAGGLPLVGRRGRRARPRRGARPARASRRRGPRGGAAVAPHGGRGDRHLSPTARRWSSSGRSARRAGVAAQPGGRARVVRRGCRPRDRRSPRSSSTPAPPRTTGQRRCWPARARDLERPARRTSGPRARRSTRSSRWRGWSSAAPRSRTLWPALRELPRRSWLLQPGDGPRVPRSSTSGWPALDRRRRVRRASPATTRSGLIEDALLALRVPAGRFGEPAVYVGTVARPPGLAFRAVRVVGLAEGHLPSVPREDPVLPDALRAAARRAAGLAAHRPPTARPSARRAPRPRRASSATPRTRVALSLRRASTWSAPSASPASVFLEAARRARPAPTRHAASAARDDPGLGAPCGATPSRPRAAARSALPPRDAPRRGRVAGRGRAAARSTLPPRWRGGSALDLGRIAGPAAPARRPGPMDGLLGALRPPRHARARRRTRPISAVGARASSSAARTASSSRRILGFDEPPAAPGAARDRRARLRLALPPRRPRPFYREHGSRALRGARARSRPGCARGRSRSWTRVFDAFLERVPARGRARAQHGARAAASRRPGAVATTTGRAAGRASWPWSGPSAGRSRCELALGGRLALPPRPHRPRSTSEGDARSCATSRPAAPTRASGKERRARPRAATSRSPSTASSPRRSRRQWGIPEPSWPRPTCTSGAAAWRSATAATTSTRTLEPGGARVARPRRRPARRARASRGRPRPTDCDVLPVPRPSAAPGAPARARAGPRRRGRRTLGALRALKRPARRTRRTDERARTPAPAPDQAERDAAIRERAAQRPRSTPAPAPGKTTILVDRLVEMVAPSGGGAGRPHRAHRRHHLHAQGGRRAAAADPRAPARRSSRSARGRRRARDAHLRAGARPGSTPPTSARSTAFADRLLRLRPVEARLSPAYEIVEDEDALVARDVRGAPAGRRDRHARRRELAGTPAAGARRRGDAP